MLLHYGVESICHHTGHYSYSGEVTNKYLYILYICNFTFFYLGITWHWIELNGCQRRAFNTWIKIKYLNEYLLYSKEYIFAYIKIMNCNLYKRINYNVRIINSIYYCVFINYVCILVFCFWCHWWSVFFFYSSSDYLVPSRYHHNCWNVSICQQCCLSVCFIVVVTSAVSCIVIALWSAAGLGLW